MKAVWWKIKYICPLNNGGLGEVTLHEAQNPAQQEKECPDPTRPSKPLQLQS